MVKNEDKSGKAAPQQEGKPSRAKLPERTQTLYTHGKKFRLPLDTDIDEFIAKKFGKGEK